MALSEFFLIHYLVTKFFPTLRDHTTYVRTFLHARTLTFNECLGIGRDSAQG